MISLLAMACGDDGVPTTETREDGGDASPIDGSPPSMSMDASVADADSDADEAAPPPFTGLWPDGGWPWPLPSVCALAVGAECDGDEDCPSGTKCCGTFDSDALTYSSIACQAECVPPAGFPLCHPGDSCDDPAHECRYSQIVPHTFIMICYEPAAEPSPLPPRGLSIPGEVVCGSVTCEVGQEKCCLRSIFHFAENAATGLEPYCAPLDAACACDDQPPPLQRPDLDAGADDEDAS